MKNITTEDDELLLEEELNEHLDRTQVAKAKSLHFNNLFKFELNNDNISQSELRTISEVVGDNDLQVKVENGWLYVVATIDDGQIEEIRSQYE